MGRNKKIKYPRTSLYVNVKDNNVERALSIFKRRVKDSGLLYEIKEKSHYKKPSEIKRDLKNRAKLRNKYRNVE